MKATTISAILVAVSALWSHPVEADNLKSVVEAGNAFTMKLYSRLAEEEGNLFFSPASIHTALGMTYAGAAGQTARQMAETLNLGASAGNEHEGFEELLFRLNSPRMAHSFKSVAWLSKLFEKPAYQLVVANALWGQEGYPWKKEFLRLTAASYGAGLREVDFATGAEVARRTINGWIETKTMDRIRDLIPPGAIDDLTRLVLTNAVYFKANWEEDFPWRATEDKPFYVSVGEEVVAPLMFQKRDFRFMETENFQALEMFYKSRDLSMLVFLPRTVDGLDAFEKSLSSEKISGWMDALSTHEVEVTFPRFRITSRFSMAENLRAMGMKDAFSATAADFSGITSQEQIVLTDVIHKAYVAVDEKGTEAAAATAVDMVATSMMPMEKPEPKVFKADHPFLFLIRHNATGSILFVGRVAHPED